MLHIPTRLIDTCRHEPAGDAWLERLPRVVAELAQRWSLVLEQPFDGKDVSCAWVAGARRSNGTSAVLKIGLPHFEATHEIEGLRFWNGNPTVRLFDADDARNAMLLERCEPGTTLRALPEPEQDRVIATLLLRLWRTPAQSHGFRSLTAQLSYWSDEARLHESEWADAGLVEAGLALFAELPRSAPVATLLATDLHAANVLSAQREPWLVIDPKPFIGDPAYDATQHLLNCRARLNRDGAGTIARFADLLGLDAERVRLWTFARVAVESFDRSRSDAAAVLARALEP